jgi:hypothetical protein
VELKFFSPESFLPFGNVLDFVADPFESLFLPFGCEYYFLSICETIIINKIIMKTRIPLDPDPKFRYLSRESLLIKSCAKKYPIALVACDVLYFPPFLLADNVQVLYVCRGMLALG